MNIGKKLALAALLISTTVGGTGYAKADQATSARNAMDVDLSSPDNMCSFMGQVATVAAEQRDFGTPESSEVRAINILPNWAASHFVKGYELATIRTVYHSGCSIVDCGKDASSACATAIRIYQEEHND